MLRLQRALARSAEELMHTGRAATVDMGARLGELAQAALTNVPGADLVGLTMRNRSGELASHGQSEPDAIELDGLQLQFGEGPCFDAITDGGSPIVEVDDFASESGRWPRFAPAAVERSVRSAMSFAMAPVTRSPGAVNIYSRRPMAFDETARAIGEAFAVQAGLALYGAQRAANLEHALSTRDIIGQAKGILMERHGMNGVVAFETLVKASQETNMKLHDVARWMIGEVERPQVRRDKRP